MALRRWKPFFPAFSAIDTAIEAATEAHSRDKYREARSSLVEMLCDAASDSDADDNRVEQLCRLLDGAMAEALLTLGAVPGPATPAMLATTGVARAVGGLLRHDAGKVRALARGVLAEWRASIEVRGAALDTLLQILREHEAVVGGPADGVEQADKVSDHQECPEKTMSPAAGSVSIAGGDRVGKEKTGDANGGKRKHAGAAGGGYCREDDDVKRRREVPEMVEHRPRKMEEVGMKSRSRGRSSRRATDERRFSTSTRHRRV